MHRHRSYVCSLFSITTCITPYFLQYENDTKIDTKEYTDTGSIASIVH